MPRSIASRRLAVLPEHQGQGVGRALVQACLEHLRGQSGATLWCNGRVSVLAFYQRLGFAPQGEIFELPVSGPHYRLVRAA